MKIGIVNDMALALHALKAAVALRPAHQVIWTAANGAEAVERCAAETPDLVLMDLIMPVMDGVEATRRIMAESPCAIVVVTASVNAHASRVFEAMGYGALDAVDTPALGLSDPSAGAAPLLKKIDTIGKLIGDKPSARRPTNESGVAPAARQDRLIAIGASAGGPAALATVLRGLPADFAAAIVIIQHVDEQFAAGMAQWLAAQCALPVRLAQEGERPVVGTALLAGTSDHLRLVTVDRLGYTSEPADYGYRPSVDVFFHSVSQRWQGEAVGVLLTGMGQDGASGLKAMRDKGCYTIAQDQTTSAVYGMPKAAAKLNAAVDILPVERIAPTLMEVLARKA
ncbi:MAG: chemotaxis response regulator protein-glutamate methylesterase [Gammaproteobacteria bacterium]|nr:chemotaxis response regulator protein-glutamate methylesterase [Gammaproteobacteria bacterium]